MKNFNEFLNEAVNNHPDQKLFDAFTKLKYKFTPKPRTRFSVDNIFNILKKDNWKGYDDIVIINGAYYFVSSLLMRSTYKSIGKGGPIINLHPIKSDGTIEKRFNTFTVDSLAGKTMFLIAIYKPKDMYNNVQDKSIKIK